MAKRGTRRGSSRGGSTSRRRIKAKPGQGTVMTRTKARKRGGRKLRNSMSVTFQVFDPLVYDFRATLIVEAVSVALAEHHRDSILKGEHPSGKSMRKLSDKSTTGKFGAERSGNTFFSNRGDSAKAWLLGDINGTSVKANRSIKPNIISHDGKNVGWMINKWLDKGIDLQSIEGKAANVIGGAVDEFIESNFGKTVSAPEREQRQGGRLDRTKKRF